MNERASMKFQRSSWMIEKDKLHFGNRNFKISINSALQGSSSNIIRFPVQKNESVLLYITVNIVKTRPFVENQDKQKVAVLQLGICILIPSHGHNTIMNTLLQMQKYRL